MKLCPCLIHFCPRPPLPAPPCVQTPFGEESQGKYARLGGHLTVPRLVSPPLCHLHIASPSTHPPSLPSLLLRWPLLPRQGPRPPGKRDSAQVLPSLPLPVPGPPAQFLRLQEDQVRPSLLPSLPPSLTRRKADEIASHPSVTNPVFSLLYIHTLPPTKLTAKSGLYGSIVTSSSSNKKTTCSMTSNANPPPPSSRAAPNLPRRPSEAPAPAAAVAVPAAAVPAAPASMSWEVTVARCLRRVGVGDEVEGEDDRCRPIRGPLPPPLPPTPALAHLPGGLAPRNASAITTTSSNSSSSSSSSRKMPTPPLPSLLCRPPPPIQPSRPPSRPPPPPTFTTTSTVSKGGEA